jgi:hypothetical protein
MGFVSPKWLELTISSSGLGNGMPQARIVRQAYGYWTIAAQIRLVASRTIVCVICREILLCTWKLTNVALMNRFENFDEYTRRQYNAKAPHLVNPFGYDEEPNKFRDFDVFLKLQVLHRLSQWTLWNPDRIREKMPEQKETEQTQWVCYQLLNYFFSPLISYRESRNLAGMATTAVTTF